MARILILEGDHGAGVELGPALVARRHTVGLAVSPSTVADTAAADRADLLLFDFDYAGAEAHDALRALRRRSPGTAVIVLSAQLGVADAVAAMKLGAVDVLARLIDPPRLLEAIEAILALRRGATGLFRMHVAGGSRAFLEAKDLAVRFAVPEINVLLLGETGAGKDVFARMIHDASKRGQGPFVPVDCSVLPGELIESELFGHEKGAFTGATAARAGRFEAAAGGTLFLDEIGNLPPAVQAKLLRVLQERRIQRVGGSDTIALDVRLLSATNVDLDDAIRRGAFRRDLYFRLAEMTITVPPLRDREGDVELLARQFVDRAARRMGRPTPQLSPAALARLRGHSWPGNVRELESAMKSAVVLADATIEPHHLPEPLRDGRDAEAAPPVPSPAAVAADSGADPAALHLQLDVPLPPDGVDLKAVGARAADEAEGAVLRALLAQGEHNLTRLARRVGLDPKSLRRKLRKHGLRMS